MIKQNKLKHKLLKFAAAFALVFGLAAQLFPSNVQAATVTLTAQVQSNGQWVDLGTNVAQSKVRLVASSPVIFYCGGQAISTNYSTTLELSTGGGSLDYYGVDQAGNTTNTLTVRLDTADTLITSVQLVQASEGIGGATSVTINSGYSRQVYFYVNGVRQDNLTTTLTLAENGTYSVYAVDQLGRQSNTLSFRIPTVATTQTTTTTRVTTTSRRPSTTTTRPSTTTTSASTAAEKLVFSVDGVENGGSTLDDVSIISANEVFFIINGEKSEKAQTSLSITEEGSYTISVENAKGQKSDDFTFTIDRTAPVVSLVVNNEEVSAEGKYNEAITIKSDEAGLFYVNGELESQNEKSVLVISESGVYTIEVKDAAGNSTTTSFTLDIKEAQSGNSIGSTILYIAIGAIAGGGIVLGVLYFINKKKNESDFDDEDDDEDDE